MFAMLCFGGLAALYFGDFASVRGSVLVAWAGKRTGARKCDKRRSKQTNAGAAPVYPPRTRVLAENRDAALI
jgi:hypothetical protein